MKRILLSFLCYLVPFLCMSKVVKGIVVDNNGVAIPYASVMLVNGADTTFINGVVTDEKGLYSLDDEATDVLLKVSALGYDTKVVTLSSDFVTVTLTESSLMLNEVVVKGHKQLYSVSKEGMEIDIARTPLSKLGSATDVLEHVPGLVKKNGDYEVFGKGKPIIYINGRQLRNSTELESLNSSDILNIEMITSPGAKYDASTPVVIKIKTKPAAGEGFGLDARSSYYQSTNIDQSNNVNWNYRHHRLDLFGTLYYSLIQSHLVSDISTSLRSDTIWEQTAHQDYHTKKRTIKGTLGTDYAINDSNSIGLRYDLSFYPHYTSRASFTSDVLANADQYDHLITDERGNTQSSPSHTINAYYTGKIGSCNIEVNVDYLQSKTEENSRYREASESFESRTVDNYSNIHNKLFATRGTVSFPLFDGELLLGGEYTFTKRKDDFLNPEAYLPSTYTDLKERHIAPFIEYTHSTPVGDVRAGLRYERTKYDYEENSVHMDDQSRCFNNLFPSISLLSQVGNVQMMLSYNTKLKRPNYQQLSSSLDYANRFLLQSGNPYLKQEYIHDVSLEGQWKFLSFSISYNDRRHAIIYWSDDDVQAAVAHVSYRNIASLKKMVATMVIAPQFGLWSPQLTIGVEKPWLSLDTSFGKTKFNKPIWQFSFENMFDFGNGWIASADASLTTKGDDENASMTKIQSFCNLSLQKSFFHDRLSLKVGGNDIFHMQYSNMLMNMGNVRSCQKAHQDTREFYVTLRYKFNKTRSKYKGTGAGNSEKERL